MVEESVRYSNLANETMESIRFRIHKIKLKLEDEGKTVTLENVRDKFLDKGITNRTILALSHNHNEECRTKVGNKLEGQPMEDSSFVIHI
jgi:hypothetical protein